MLFIELYPQRNKFLHFVSREMPGAGPGGYPDQPPLNGVERIAADMMAIRLPPHHQQVGRPGQRPQVGSGWQAMPPILPPAGTSPNIPTAIVPPGVPPHGRPLASGGETSGYHGSDRGESVHHPQQQQQGRMESRVGGGWSTGGHGAEPGGYVGRGPGSGRDFPNHHQQQAEGSVYSSNGGRTGGSGRIIPNSSGKESIVCFWCSLITVMSHWGCVGAVCCIQHWPTRPYCLPVPVPSSPGFKTGVLLI
jgi:hypothetical protein